MASDLYMMGSFGSAVWVSCSWLMNPISEAAVICVALQKELEKVGTSAGMWLCGEFASKG